MATIVVNDLNNVTVDGVNAGSVTDVLQNQRNVPGIRGDMMTALQAWLARRNQAHEDEKAALRADHASAVAARETRVADLQRALAEQVAQVKALGGTPLAQRLAAEARIREIREAKAQLDVELAGLDPLAGVR